MSKNEYRFYDNQDPNFEKTMKFTDPYFKADDDSVFGKFEETWTYEQKEKYYKFKEDFKKEKLGIKKNENISWLRIYDSNSVIPFAKDEGDLDIKQGFLGDCYFISFIHSLRQNYPEIFNSILGNCQLEKGYFEMYIYIEKSGEITKQKIFVDDYIPYKKLPRIYESLARPLFSSYYYFSKEINEPKFINYMVGQYLLIEKAFAKYKGSYLNIEGSANNNEIYFLLTGVKEKIYYLTDDILMKYQEVKDIKEKVEKEINLEKEKMIKEIKEEEKEKEKVEKKIKELKAKIFSKIQKEVKKQAIENYKLDKEKKSKIFDEIKQFSKTNLFTLGTEPQCFIGKINSFGIYGNHRYDFLDCEKHNESFFFSLWNPHGNNSSLKEYQGFDEINKRNKEGMINGNIILSFDGFFLSFKRMIYQNRDELLKMHKKYNNKGILDYSLDYHMRLVLMSILGPDINFIITLLLIKKILTKGKNSKEIFSELLNKIKIEEKMDRFQIVWFLTIWNDLKKDIIKESEDIMINKSKTNLNTLDREEIKKILIQENEKKNEFLAMFSKTNETFLKEYLQEINKEIESIAIKIAEDYIKQNQSDYSKENKSKKSIKIQSGCFFVRFPWQKHYMNNSTGERSVVGHICFDEEYETIPQVMASISGLDAGNEKAVTIRIDVNVENIDTSGFDLRIKTWLDSMIFNVKISWISFG